MNDKLYKSKRWNRIRRAVLARDGYMCQISKRYGKMVEAEIVHHILPVEEYPQYAFASWNLISLSKAEHNKMHDRDTNELTEAGKELRRKLKAKGYPPDS